MHRASVKQAHQCCIADALEASVTMSGVGIAEPVRAAVTS